MVHSSIRVFRLTDKDRTLAEEDAVDMRKKYQKHPSGGQVDQRTDVYAIGLIFHETLVGRRRSSDSAISELMARVRQAPASVRSLDAQIPGAVDRIVARCVNPDPAQRYQTSAQLLADLNRLDAEGCELVERQPAVLADVLADLLFDQPVQLRIHLFENGAVPVAIQGQVVLLERIGSEIE